MDIFLFTLRLSSDYRLSRSSELKDDRQRFCTF